MSDDISKPVPAEPAHDHAPGERCTAPGPWFSFGLTGAMALILVLAIGAIRYFL